MAWTVYICSSIILLFKITTTPKWKSFIWICDCVCVCVETTDNLNGRKNAKATKKSFSFVFFLKTSFFRPKTRIVTSLTCVAFIGTVCGYSRLPLCASHKNTSKNWAIHFSFRVTSACCVYFNSNTTTGGKRERCTFDVFAVCVDENAGACTPQSSSEHKIDLSYVQIATLLPFDLFILLHLFLFFAQLFLLRTQTTNNHIFIFFVVAQARSPHSGASNRKSRPQSILIRAIWFEWYAPCWTLPRNSPSGRSHFRL